MKRLPFVLLGALLVFSVILMSCEGANEFGGSFDISMICGDEACTLAPNTDVYLTQDEPLYIWLRLKNNMVPVDGSVGPTVRTRRMEVRYLAANKEPIIERVEEFTVNVEPGGEVTYPVDIFSYEQIEYVRDRMGLFPDTPFGVSCAITVFYDTTGGQSDSVERLLSIHVHM